MIVTVRGAQRSIGAHSAALQITHSDVPLQWTIASIRCLHYSTGSRGGRCGCPSSWIIFFAVGSLGRAGVALVAAGVVDGGDGAGRLAAVRVAVADGGVGGADDPGRCADV